jgi:hypothetical protein
MPGIIDSHVRMTGDTGRTDWYWLKEAPPLRDVASLAEAAKMLAVLGQRAPRVVVAGPIVTAPGGYAGIDYKSLVGLYVDGPEDAREKVGALLDEGSDIIKISLEPVGLPVMSLETAQAITQLAHERGTVVTAHAILDGPPGNRRWVDSLAHAPLEVPPAEMVDEMIAKGMYVVSTLDIYGGHGARFSFLLRRAARSRWAPTMAVVSRATSRRDAGRRDANLLEHWSHSHAGHRSGHEARRRGQQPGR